MYSTGWISAIRWMFYCQSEDNPGTKTTDSIIYSYDYRVNAGNIHTWSKSVAAWAVWTIIYYNLEYENL